MLAIDFLYHLNKNTRNFYVHLQNLSHLNSKMQSKYIIKNTQHKS